MATTHRMIDTHCHVLSAVDDGPVSLDESVAVVRELVEQGVTDIVTTPHYINGTSYTSTKVQNKKILETLKNRLKAENVKVNILLGNEIYVDNDILKLLEKKKISPLAKSKYLLVELPLDEEYPNYKDILWDLMNSGYQVILAHPERYTIVQENYGILNDIQELGVLFQCNITSIIGRYGRKAKKIVKEMLKNKMVFALASDTHHCGKMDYIDLSIKKLSKYCDEAELNQLLVKNPSKIIKG